MIVKNNIDSKSFLQMEAALRAAAPAALVAGGLYAVLKAYSTGRNARTRGRPPVDQLTHRDIDVVFFDWLVNSF